jgi:zinc protease
MPRTGPRPDSVERTRLANGLRIVACRDARAPLVVTRAAVRAGSREEPADRCGLAHLCEHLACDGPTHAAHGSPDTDATLSARVRRLGGASHGWIVHDYATFGATVPSDALRQALRLDGERLAWRPAEVPEDRLRLEAETLLQERHDRGSASFAREVESVQRLLYPVTHPYHRPAIGVAKGLRAITREDATAFVDACYKPNRTVVIAVGDLDPDALARHASDAFSGISNGSVDSERDAVATPRDAAAEAGTVMLPSLQEPRHAVVEVSVPYVRTYLAMRAPGHGAPGWHAMSMVARWLGTGRSNPLHRRLVDELGVAQEVRVCWESYRDASTLAFACTALPDISPARLEHALSHALDDALSDGPNAADLERARTKALLDYYANFDSLETRADWLATLAMLRSSDAADGGGGGAAAAADADDEVLEAIGREELLAAAQAHAMPHQRVTLSLVPRRAA